MWNPWNIDQFLYCAFLVLECGSASCIYHYNITTESLVCLLCFLFLFEPPDGYLIFHFLGSISSLTITWWAQACSRVGTEEGDFTRSLSTAGSSGAYLFLPLCFYFLFFASFKKKNQCCIVFNLEMVGWFSIVNIYLFVCLSVLSPSPLWT